MRFIRSIRRIAATGGIVVAAVVMGATVATGSATAKPATGAPIKISVQSLVNDPAFSWPGVLAGARAAALAIDQAGGVGLGHHRLVVVTCDNQLNPNVAETCAHDAVSAGVVADVG